MRENAKFGISYAGTDGGFCSTLENAGKNILKHKKIEVVAFNLTTEPCLPDPKNTDKAVLLPIYLLLLACLLSCALSAYMNRLKHQICNVFFPDRAKERAKFLDREIKIGRGRRKRELGIIFGFHN